MIKKVKLTLTAFLLSLPTVIIADTLKATSESGQKLTVRLVGIDAPELGRGKGKAGLTFLATVGWWVWTVYVWTRGGCVG